MSYDILSHYDNSSNDTSNEEVYMYHHGGLKFEWNSCQILKQSLVYLCMLTNSIIKYCHGWLKFGCNLT